MILCSLFTPDYAPARAFVASLRRHAPDTRIVLVEREFDPPLLAALEKPILMRSLMEQHHEAVLWLDADTIVRRPLYVLEAILANVDLTVLHRPHTSKRGPMGSVCACRFNTGVVGVANTDGGRAFLTRWAEVIAIRPSAHLLLDQEAAYLAYRGVRSRVRFQPLPAGYNDSRFLPRTAIWHGKGSARRHILFRLEAARYAHGLPLGGVIQILQCARKAEPIRRAYAQWWKRREATAAHPR
ncbi:MAG TPA: hypothetical protein VM366_17800 [Anaerolineae bacterium]|nr:hypothetical protein [Anaerolineae bacterium]